MKTIAWIGVGIMGKSMVRNLRKAGFCLHIYARNRAKVEDVIAEGAIFHDTIGDCVQGCDVVVTMVGFPQDVEEVYFQPGNILDRAAPGTYLIDMTTTSPTLAQRLYSEGTARGFRVLDAPVTGGDTGARDGTLSILVGGEEADYQACLPIFQAMGTNINHQGPAGCGQHAKLANQTMIAGTLSGICEALTYAKAQGLDTTQGGMAVREFSDYDSISPWAGQSMTWAVNAGILSGRGNNTLAPTAGATRAEMAVMLQQFVGLMEK